LFEDRLLDWEPSTGRFRVWHFDRHTRGGDPLPSTTCEGQWNSIRGQKKLIFCDGDQVLEWDQSNGGYRLWGLDRHNRQDPFPGSPIVQGSWNSIRGARDLVYLSNDRMLDWEPRSGAYRVWQVDRSGRTGDFLPGSPVMEGSWQSIRGSNKLIRVAQDQVLDWDPETGRYRVWAVRV
jgi:hypothetical protein